MDFGICGEFWNLRDDSTILILSFSPLEIEDHNVHLNKLF